MRDIENALKLQNALCMKHF